VKIVLVCHYLPPKSGGIEHVVDQLARGYLDAGCDVLVVGYRAKEQSVGTLPYSTCELRGWNGLERFGIPVPIVEPFTSWSRIGRALNDADALHAHGMSQPSSMMALLRARRLGSPVIVTEHVGSIPMSNRILDMVQSSMLRIAARLVRRSSGTMVVLNDRVLHEMESFVAPGQVLKIRNGVDLDRFRPVTGDEKRFLQEKWGIDGPTVLAVARNVPKKGLQVLSDACDRSVTFSVVFAGQETEALSSHDGRRRGIGVVSQDDCAELYRAVDLFVLPSFGEGLPLVALEAMASGLPVILGDDPAVRSELPDGPVKYVPTGDPGALAWAIEEMLSDGESLEFLGNAARDAMVVGFSWQGVVHEYLELLNPERRRKDGFNG